MIEFDIKDNLLGNVVGFNNEGYQTNVNEDVTLNLKDITGLVGKLSIKYSTATS